MAGIVKYWEDPYVPTYMGDCFGDTYTSQVDSQVLYKALEDLTIKVASETTGVDSIEWFDEIPVPDLRNPFKAMVMI